MSFAMTTNRERGNIMRDNEVATRGWAEMTGSTLSSFPLSRPIATRVGWLSDYRIMPPVVFARYDADGRRQMDPINVNNRVQTERMKVKTPLLRALL